jgi:hypothetical protein
MVVYLVGSLRNPEVPKVARMLRDVGLEVFDDWHAAGDKADEEWMKYEQERGRNYYQALQGHSARHTFSYDKFHLDRSDVGVMVAPAGKSGHLELGYLIGQGKPGYIYLPVEPERWDVMTLFATKVLHNATGLLAELQLEKSKHAAAHTSDF